MEIMKKQIRLLLFYLFTFTPLALSAQEADGSLRQIYEQAENDYQIGRLEQSLELLQSNLGRFSGNLRQSAYRLIALCYLGQDKMEETESYASPSPRLQSLPSRLRKHQCL